MKLLHIIGSVNPSGGGPIEVILRLHEVTQGEAIHEIASLDQPGAPFLSGFPITTHALGSSPQRNAGWMRPLVRYGYAPHIIPWLKENTRNYDCVVVHGLWNYSKFAASRVLPGGKVSYIVFPHGMLDPWFQQRYPLKRIAKQLSWWVCEGRLMAGARSVLFTAEEEKLRARGAFWGYRYKESVVGLGTADPPNESGQEACFRAMVPLLGQRSFLLFLSRIHPKKGCDLLLDAFTALTSSHPEIDLVIAGPDQVGLRAKLERYAAEQGIAHRVHWPGMLTGAAKLGAYRAAEAFILPSHQENFGIVVAEAASCCTPVLITNKVNIWREIERSGGGFVENDDLAGVKQLLKRFLALDSTQRAVMKQAARRCFEEHFDMQSAGRSFLAAIKAAIQMK